MLKMLRNCRREENNLKIFGQNDKGIEIFKMKYYTTYFGFSQYLNGSQTPECHF